MALGQMPKALAFPTNRMDKTAMPHYQTQTNTSQYKARPWAREEIRFHLHRSCLRIQELRGRHRTVESQRYHIDTGNTTCVEEPTSMAMLPFCLAISSDLDHTFFKPSLSKSLMASIVSISAYKWSVRGLAKPSIISFIPHFPCHR